MKKGYKEYGIQLLGVDKPTIKIVEGKEVFVEGFRCFQHDDPNNSAIKVVSEYSTGIKVGAAGTYKEAAENAADRINTAGLSTTRKLIKDGINRYGVLNL